MIVFGTAISDREVYERIALPSIRRVREPDSPVLVREGYDSIQRPYNEMMDEAAGHPELEALILLHQDLELTDGSLLSRVRPLLKDPRTGLIGLLGACKVRLHCWTATENLFGTSVAPGVEIRHSVGSHEVQGVDGAMLVMAPWVVRSIRFGEALAERFHGYDVDFSLRVRAAGGRVICNDVPYIHHMSRLWEDDREAIRDAGIALARMWDPALRPREWAPAFRR